MPASPAPRPTQSALAVHTAARLLDTTAVLIDLRDHRRAVSCLAVALGLLELGEPQLSEAQTDEHFEQLSREIESANQFQLATLHVVMSELLLWRRVAGF